MERGTCDVCNVDADIEMVVLCDECGQSNQICKDCLENVNDGEFYCRDCDCVLDTV